MKILLTVEHDTDWIPLNNRVEFYIDTKIPQKDLITSVHVLAFLDDQMLFTKHPKRGWDIPGGHVKKDETPITALEREVYEETYAKLTNLRVFGYIKITLFEKDLTQLKHQFPESYILLYIGHVGSLDPFVGKYETLDRRLFTPTEAKRLSWVKRYRPIYDAAFNEIQNITRK
jgi:8-oxo-dGTP diphosphatase